MSLDQILAAAPAATIDQAIAMMQAIDETLPDADGVKWFNRLYLRVTISVGSAVRAARFNDPAFLARLDVVFANLYFSALAAGLADAAAAPAAWRPLLLARHNRGIARIQFALAGINAHINRDLPDGIVESFVALGGDPISDRVRKEDFDRVNDLLEQVEQQVKAEFSVGAVEVVDRLGGPVDDALAFWKVRKARSAAWTNAQVLWALRGTPALRDEFFSRLDSLIGVSGRGLLLPIRVAAATDIGAPIR
jgi:Family of unknown function (DUF5995)